MELAQLTSATLDWINGYGSSILIALTVLIVGWYLAKWLAYLVVQLLPNTKAFDDTVAPMFGQLVRYGVIITAIVIALSGLGVQTASIIAVIGAAGWRSP